MGLVRAVLALAVRVEDPDARLMALVHGLHELRAGGSGWLRPVFELKLWRLQEVDDGLVCERNELTHGFPELLLPILYHDTNLE